MSENHSRAPAKRKSTIIPLVAVTLIIIGSIVIYEFVQMQTGPKKASVILTDFAWIKKQTEEGTFLNVSGVITNVGNKEAVNITLTLKIYSQIYPDYDIPLGNLTAGASRSFSEEVDICPEFNPSMMNASLSWQ